MADYRLVAFNGSSAVGELAALDRRLEFRLERPSMVMFRINAAHPSAYFFNELATDIVVYRDGVKIARTVVTSTRDLIDEDSHYIDVTAMDYKGRLAFRRVLTTQTYTAEDDVDIAFQAITNAQAETNGNMGITRGVFPTGIPLTGSFPAGISVAEAIDLIANVDDGFDWEIDEELRFNIYRVRGNVAGRILDYGGLVSRATREFAAVEFANSVRVSGDDSIPSIVVGSGDPTIGRWDKQVGFPQVDNSTLLAGLGIDELARSTDQAVTFTVRLRDSEGIQRWGGPSDIGLGDTIRLVVNSNRLNVNKLTRVREIDVTVSDDGAEEVTFVLDGPKRTFEERINFVLQRLTELERQ
jgi:hypothetical protein